MVMRVICANQYVTGVDLTRLASCPESLKLRRRGSDPMVICSPRCICFKM